MNIKNLLRNVLASVIAFVAAATGLAWFLARRGGELDTRLAGENQTWRWRDFEINYNCAGSGEPIVLLHALYPGASNEQWEDNFNALSKTFRVFAPDLPGFGRSSRPTMAYTPEIFKECVADFLREVVEKSSMVVVSGQSVPFAVEAADAHPELISRLVFCSPTGLTRMSDRPPLAQRLMYRLWAAPVIGTLIFFWMTSKRQIARQLRADAVADPTLITPGMINGIYRQSHQPGAKWAPIAMLGGRLNVDASSEYRRLTQPILVLWGEMPSYIPISDAKDFLDSNSNAVLGTFPDAKLMPEFEHAAKFNADIQMWAQGKQAA